MGEMRVEGYWIESSLLTSATGNCIWNPERVEMGNNRNALW